MTATMATDVYLGADAAWGACCRWYRRGDQLVEVLWDEPFLVEAVDALVHLERVAARLAEDVGRLSPDGERRWARQLLVDDLAECRRTIARIKEACHGCH